jgi:hypothetical protein
MNLLSQIRPGTALPIYETLKQILRGNEAIIFESMVAVTAGRNAFQAPIDNSQYDIKHAEIEARLRTADMNSSRRFPLRLMTEICRQTKMAQAGLPRHVYEHVRETIKISIEGEDISIGISDDLNWESVWQVKHRNFEYDEKVHLNIYSTSFEEIVPRYVIEYIGAALHSYRQKLNFSCAALLSITVEAILRDVLIERGYSFRHGEISVDSYKYTDANVSVSGNDYLVSFQNPRLKPATDLTASSGGNPTSIKVRRYIPPKNAGRIDFYVLAPAYLIDHWSLDEVETAGNPKNLGGLGQAFTIAREVENFLDNTMLPLAFEEVIKTLRNNLIHLSQETLDKELDVEDSEGNKMTLNQFLDDPDTLFSFVTNILRFINDIYTGLRT